MVTNTTIKPLVPVSGKEMQLWSSVDDYGFVSKSGEYLINRSESWPGVSLFFPSLL